MDAYTPSIPALLDAASMQAHKRELHQAYLNKKLKPFAQPITPNP